MKNNKPSLLKRAATAGRTPEEQIHLEDISFQMGYKYCTIEITKGDKSNYVHQRFLAGQELGRRILRNQGKLFA